MPRLEAASIKMSMKYALVAGAIAALTGCTHGHVSTVPTYVEGVGNVYRYEGRANFGHQLADADRMITEHCQQVNGGRPVILDHQTRDLGPLAVGTPQGVTVTGNQNQILYYQCVTG